MKKHMNVADVQADSCVALGNLAWNDANPVRVMALGGIQEMKNQENVADVQEYNRGALENLSRHELVI